MILDNALPWYTVLVGASAKSEEFDRLVSQFRLSSDDEWDAGARWYENAELGVSVYVLRGSVDAIQFFSAENPHFKQFSEPLPLNLSFHMTRPEVRRLLGNPEHVTPERQAGTVQHAGIDRYHTPACTIAVSYSAKSGRVEVLGFERPAIPS